MKTDTQNTKTIDIYSYINVIFLSKILSEDILSPIVIFFLISSMGINIKIKGDNMWKSIGTALGLYTSCHVSNSHIKPGTVMNYTYIPSFDSYCPLKQML